MNPSEVLRIARKEGWIRAFAKGGRPSYMIALRCMNTARFELEQGFIQFEEQAWRRAIALAEEVENETELRE